MPLAERLVHALALVAPTDSGDVDDYGQPIPGEPVVTVLAGFLYPTAAREVEQANQAGAELGDHAVVFPLRAIPAAGYIRREPDDGERYEIRGSDPYAFGHEPLVVVHVRRVTSSAAETVS
jgi:hypothetical protein